MTKISKSLWNSEPTLVVGVVQIIIMIVVFKLKLDESQTTMILTALTALSVGVLRQTVSSPATVATTKAKAAKAVADAAEKA